MWWTFLVCQRSLMQSSTRAMRPVAMMTLERIVRSGGSIWRWTVDLLCDVGQGIKHRLISDPHEARWHPSTSAFIGQDLTR
jgi:hypothetical protein